MLNHPTKGTKGNPSNTVYFKTKAKAKQITPPSPFIAPPSFFLSDPGEGGIALLRIQFHSCVSTPTDPVSQVLFAFGR